MRLTDALRSASVHRLLLAVALAVQVLTTLAAGANTAKPLGAEAQKAQAELSVHFEAITLGDLDAEREEIAYLRSISKPHETIVNNLADDLQLRFTLRSLKKAGRTPQNAPQLFAILASMRTKHLVQAPSPDLVLDTAAGRQPLNIVTSLGPVVASADASAVAGSTTYSATGVSSIANGTLTTMATMQLFDGSTNLPIGPGNSNQQFGEGEDLLVTQTSDNPTIPNVGAFFQVTYQASVSTAPITITAPAELSAMPVAPPNVGAPTNLKGHKYTVVCLSRATTPDQNCDFGPYEAASNNPLVELPVSGNITFPLAIDSKRQINGTLIVWGQNGGGGCALQLDPSQKFSSAFHVGSNGKELIWMFFHVTRKGAVFTAPFAVLNNNPCWQPGQPYGMTLTVSVPLVGQVARSEFFVTTTPGPAVGNVTRIPALQFTWGCFAEGTLVLLADGSTKPVEQIVSGDILISGFNGRRLTVRETTKGNEAEPMVNITDAAGHYLSVTDGHAVLVAGSGGRPKVVLAKALKVGDLLYTSDLAIDQAGKPTHFRQSRIRKIDRVKTAAHVYNVYLGVPGEHFGKDDTTLIAGGILTGDNAMQEYFGADFHFKPAKVKQRIPPEWHRDYDNFLKLKPSAGQAQEQL